MNTAALNGTIAHALLEKSILEKRHPSKYIEKTVEIKDDKRHAVLSPSSADRWMVCTASIEYTKNELSDSTSGTFTISKEHIDAAGPAYEWALDKKLAGYKVYSEKYVDIFATQEGGTVDITAIQNKHLFIADLKSGTFPVKAKNNRQMKLYALGIIDAFDLRKKVKQITMVIIQPACGEPDSDTITIDDLLEFETEVIRTRKQIASGDVKFVPGHKQCAFCKGKKRCRAYANMAIETAQLDFEQITRDKLPKKSSGCESLTVDELATIAHNLPFINDWIKSINQTLLDLAAKNKLPGFKLVAGISHRKWSKDDEIIATALRRAGFNIDDYMPRTLVGITAASKLFNDPTECEKFMKKNTIKPEGKPILVPEEDPHPSITTAADYDRIQEEI